MKNKEIVLKNAEAKFECKFLNVYELQYEDGRHYYNATRRPSEDIVAKKSDEEFKSMLPDAVSCIVIVNSSDGPRLLLSKEYRYPTGHYILGVPAGLIDDKDVDREEAIRKTAIREIKEETGIDVDDNDKISIINPLLFSTPGMTDESNAIVLVELNNKDPKTFTQEGAVGLECFDGLSLLSVDEARRIVLNGMDDEGIFYSVFTYIALTYFINMKF